MQADPVQQPVPTAGQTVRDATFDVFRRRGLTTLFANPGSTEVPFLTDLPGDLDVRPGPARELRHRPRHRLCARTRRSPSLALLHTTAGLGNGVAAIATARVNRAPVVVLVGQQDRRHLAYEPFLAGRLAGLAGDYPVRVEQPVRAQDVPAAVERAFHAAAVRARPGARDRADERLGSARGRRARAGRGGRRDRARRRGRSGGRRRPRCVPRRRAISPAIVVGAGADDAPSRAARRRARRAARRARLPGGVRRARRLSARPSRCSPACCPPVAPGLRERLAPYDTLLVDRRPGVPSVASMRPAG